MKKSTIIQVIGGLLISSAGIYIFLKKVNIAEVWNQIRATQWWVIAVVAALSPLSMWFRTMRWKIMLPSRDGTEKKGLFSIVIIAFMINNILPARLGEAARALLLWRRNKFTAVESIGSLVVERALDSLIFLSFLFVPIFFKKALGNLFLYGTVCLVGFVAAIGTLAVYGLFPEYTKKKALFLSTWIPGKIRVKISNVSKELVSNLDWVFSVEKVTKVILLSFLTIFCYVGMIWLLGFQIQSFGCLDSMFGVAFAALGAAIPLSPGYVGTLHAMLSEGLTLLGVTVERAGAIAILYHAIGYIIITVLGIYFFFTTNVSMSEIGKAKETLKNKDR